MREGVRQDFSSPPWKSSMKKKDNQCCLKLMQVCIHIILKYVKAANFLWGFAPKLLVENVTFAERVLEVFDTAKWQALKSGQKGSHLMFKDNSYYIYPKMGQFWAQNYFFEFFSKYIHWAFMNLYLMKGNKKKVKVTVFNFGRKFSLFP